MHAPPAHEAEAILAQPSPAEKVRHPKHPGSTWLYHRSAGLVHDGEVPGKSGVGGGILRRPAGRFCRLRWSPPRDRYGISVAGPSPQEGFACTLC
jgi:hypothetical protein